MSLKTKVLTAAAFAALLASTAVQAVTYTVGTGATYRPFEYEAPNKEIVGFDIDLMKAIAKAQGFDVEFVNTTWSTIFPALNNGDRDIIMSGITITDKRKEAVDFSEPYFLAHQLILTSSNLQIKSLKDLEGKLIAVVNASAGDVGVLQWYMKQNPDKKFNQCRDPEFQEQYFGIGVRKGNTQVLNDVNAGLKKVIESGAYNEVYRKWFGSDAPKLPAFTK